MPECHIGDSLIAARRNSSEALFNRSASHSFKAHFSRPKYLIDYGLQSDRSALHQLYIRLALHFTPSDEMLSPATRYEQVKETLGTSPRKWLITGVGGFVGSHLLETLLKLNQHVVGLENWSTGQRKNLARVHSSVGDSLWRRFTLHSGDVRN